jgi:hypothetical protein
MNSAGLRTLKRERGLIDPDDQRIPPEVPWSEMVHYECRWCKHGCINHIEADCTLAKECRECWLMPVLGEVELATDHLPDDYDP